MLSALEFSLFSFAFCFNNPSMLGARFPRALVPRGDGGSDGGGLQVNRGKVAWHLEGEPAAPTAWTLPGPSPVFAMLMVPLSGLGLHAPEAADQGQTRRK